MTYVSKATGINTDTVDTTPVEIGDGRRTSHIEQLNLQVQGTQIAQTLLNMVTILDGLDVWDSVFAFNELTEQVLVMRPLPNSPGNPKLHRSRRLCCTNGAKGKLPLSPNGLILRTQ